MSPLTCDLSIRPQIEINREILQIHESIKTGVHPDISAVSDVVRARLQLLLEATAEHRPEESSTKIPLDVARKDHVFYGHLEGKYEDHTIYWDIQKMEVSSKVVHAIATVLETLERNCSEIEGFPFNLKLKGYLRGHLVRTALYAARIAEIYNLKVDQGKIQSDEIEGRDRVEKVNVINVAIAAVLHDIGKKEGKIYDAVRKHGRVTDAEYLLIKGHPELGALAFLALEKIGGVRTIFEELEMKGLAEPGAESYKDFVETVHSGILEHHVGHRTDKHYPVSIQMKDTSLTAKIIAVADAMDSMMSDRDHRDNDKNGPQFCRLELDKCSLGAANQFERVFAQIGMEMIDAGINPVIAMRSGVATAPKGAVS